MLKIAPNGKLPMAGPPTGGPPAPPQGPPGDAPPLPGGPPPMPDAPPDLAGGAPDTPKGQVHPEIAGYMGPDLGPFACGRCVHFDGQSSCEIVSGPIDPAGLCNLFEPVADQPDAAGPPPGPDAGAPPPPMTPPGQ